LTSPLKGGTLGTRHRSVRETTVDTLKSDDLKLKRREGGASHGRRFTVWIALAATLVAAVAIAIVAWPEASPEPSNPTSGILTPEQKREFYEATIESRWAEIKETFPSAVRPTETLVRFVARDDYGTVIVNCLADRNQDAIVLGGGSDYRLDVAQGEQSAAIAEFACISQYPLDPSEPRLSDYATKRLYQYLVEELVPCLEREGYEISEPPTLEEFGSGLQGDTPWSPYRDVEETDAARFAEVRSACPPLPDDLAL
jgi:hypothetical protein